MRVQLSMADSRVPKPPNERRERHKKRCGVLTSHPIILICDGLWRQILFAPGVGVAQLGQCLPLGVCNERQMWVTN